MSAIKLPPPDLPTAERAQDDTLQEWVYKQLRHAIMTGHFVPGHSVTIRGVAEMLGVSLMPVREALRRLVAERALELLANRRVTVPRMTPAKLDELCAARIALETLAAIRALPAIDAERLAELRRIDAEVDVALAAGDVPTYLEKNQEFHLTLYRAGDSQVLIPLIESLWLQFGPFMRMVLGRIGASYVLDRHAEALAAIERKDALAVRLAIEGDIRDGMGSIGQEELLNSLQAVGTERPRLARRSAAANAAEPQGS
ncbi:GntR family transcriptional regulator [Plasticicumulans lactativorans]|uniref:GntR family transcriptional regulator n=1 Tax=Plasticicumulans lactativorans TaxID=1133106 RepID=A0A4R2L9L5_9GAMM|nr:GntR family transcriptional regulator [Plasticicumulans lactativorans]TCO83471.1 GntR family transcriptional regulator [Plasticicumulans lactativorans]